MIALYPGSFDPITYGHLDIILRAAKLCEKVIIVIMSNDEKDGTFSCEERKKMIEQCTSTLENVEIHIGSGLTIDYALKVNANVLIRGVRAVTDYEYEMQLATTNMALNSDIETLFLMAKPEYSFLSSSTAKTIAKNGGDLSYFVPDNVAKELYQKYK
ncbi:MAG TPA: pantetheine-phosphate adenylyltransferase [Erysipelotrichaceae bacterium]|jgi:pantetheine-phosphate adenylyltransferase|nr:pantetheine-phosphate adenylyltransferase [Erysipelotrichia bacterium]HPX33366.1 pantetheine-phosphate adenylyltransferase [Erysipelotrichaceae bacterium]HQA85783.1 pantetheine-phosphate adenylyltransferase [Erysipelotrichaceae bacterium]